MFELRNGSNWLSLRGRLREIGGGVVRRVMLFGNRMDENMFRTVAISETVFWRRRAGERERERVRQFLNSVSTLLYLCISAEKYLKGSYSFGIKNPQTQFSQYNCDWNCPIWPRSRGKKKKLFYMSFRLTKSKKKLWWQTRRVNSSRQWFVLGVTSPQATAWKGEIVRINRIHHDTLHFKKKSKKKKYFCM